MPHPTRSAARPRRAVAVAVLASAVLTAALAACSSGDDQPAAPTAPDATRAEEAVERTGELEDGARWRLRSPDDWNGTLLLYSRGLTPPGEANVVLDAPDETTAQLLLDAGFALVGSSYEEAGWTLGSALSDQRALLDVAAAELGPPTRTIAWGHSLGGLVTVGLAEEHPDDLDGALAACGIVGGAELLWDPLLDLAFVLRTLLVGDEAAVGLTGFDGPADSTYHQLSQRAAAALASPEGRARVALAAAVADVPGWAPDGRARPAEADARGQLEAQAANVAYLLLVATVFRADMEAQVGGNPSSNAGIDYGAVLDAAASEGTVRRLYDDAGLDLAEDLALLAGAPRAEADPEARAALLEPVQPSGALEVPLLLLHGTADALAPGFHVRTYAGRVRDADADLLRVAAVERPGHCSFTPAEQVAALGVLTRRVDDGRWPDTSSSALDAAARALGDAANVTAAADGATEAEPPAFVEPRFPPAPRARAGHDS